MTSPAAPAALAALLLVFCASSACAVDLAACSEGSEPLAPLAVEPLLVLGEIHGTQETPSLVGAHACALLRSGKRVLLALEIPNEEQGRIDVFLGAAGDARDVQNLLAGRHWTRPPEQQDGRSSEAMFHLIELARQLSRATGRIQVAAVDQWQGDAPRDALMAKNIEAARARFAGYSTIVLVGNMHAAGVRGSLFDPAFESMAYHLQAHKPYSIDVVPLSGALWNCSPACGVHAFTAHQDPPQAAGLKPGFTQMPGFQATLFLKRSSASPPAIARLRP